MQKDESISTSKYFSVFMTNACKIKAGRPVYLGEGNSGTIIFALYQHALVWMKKFRCLNLCRKIYSSYFIQAVQQVCLKVAYAHGVDLVNFYTNNDKIADYASFGFDVNMSNIFCTLLNGGTSYNASRLTIFAKLS